MSERQRGTVKWFSAPKGYGFIGQENDEEDVFVHFSVIEMDGYRKLRKGQVVEFAIEQGAKGLQAINVVPKDEFVEIVETEEREVLEEIEVLED